MRRIESHERRVDADDLVALAVALSVSPLTLLMPDTPHAADIVTVTGIPGAPAEDMLAWLRAEVPLVSTPVAIDHAMNVVRRGLVCPVSARCTVLVVTPSRAANSPCESPTCCLAITNR